MPVSKKRGRSGPSKWARSNRRRKTWQSTSRPVMFAARKKRPLKTPFARAVRSVIMSNSETKVNYHSGTFGGGALTHNTLTELVLQDLTSSATGLSIFEIPPGAALNNRIGTELYAKAIYINGQFQIPANRPNVNIKIWLVEYNPDVKALTQANFQRNVTNNVMIDPINFDHFKPKLLWQRWSTARDVVQPVVLYPDNSNYDYTVRYQLKIPLNRIFKYDTASNLPTRGMKKRLSLYCAVYDTQSTSLSVVNNNQMAVTLYWKDV